MTLSFFRTLALAGLLAVFAQPASAAIIDPPSKFLFKGEHAIVAGEVTGVSADGTLSLHVRETLHGAAAPAEIDVRTSPASLAHFERGQRVLVGYTLYRRSSTRPKALELRRDGAVILVSAGVEPALFLDTTATRAMLAGKPADALASSRGWLDQALRGLASKDLATQNFHAAELALREPLHALLLPADRRAIAAFIADRSRHPSARASLLSVAASHPAQFGEGWPLDAALAIVAGTPVAEAEADASLVPNMVRVAFDVLDRSERKVPVASAQRWLASAQVGLAEAALLAIRRTEPARERELAEAALATPELMPSSREFLRDHLRRLAIMQDALDAGRGAGGEQG